MKLRGSTVVLSHDGTRLSAVWGDIRKERVRVAGWLHAQRPEDVDANDTSAVGEWIGATLREAGCSARACVIAIPRASVVLKRLSFPSTDETGEGDLASMVQFQMSRQLTMPLHGAAIDFVRLGEATASESKSSSIAVLAAALPGDHVTWCKEIAKAAKLRVRSVALRGEGSAALFAQISYTEGGAVLGLSVTPHGVELGVIEEGRVAFSRAADLPAPKAVQDWGDFGERVAIEAKRTRIAYRGTGEAPDLVCVGILGDDALAASVGKSVGEALSLPWHEVRFPQAIDIAGEMDNATRAGLAPLIGLMLGAAIGRPTYDFANPRRASDTAAPLRQAMLAAALGIIIFGGGAFVVADQQLRALQARRDTAYENAISYQDKYLRQLRSQARLAHLEKMREARVDWVEHLAYLSDSMPPAEQARLDTISGAIRSSVRIFERGTTDRPKSLQSADWMLTRGIDFSLSGQASPDVSSDLRADLVASEVYEAQTRGPDAANRFEYLLTARASSPQEVLARKKEGAQR